MAAPLYARYVPPKAPVQIKVATVDKGPKDNLKITDPPTRDPNQKRKRGGNETKRSRKKGKIDHGAATEPDTLVGVASMELDGKPLAKQDHRDPEPGVGESLPPSSKQPQQVKGTVERRKKKKETKKSASKEEGTEPIEEDEQAAKHSRIMSKFQKSIKSKPLQQDDEQMLEAPEEPELHDLVPIPIPEAPDQPAQQTAFSVLPAWLSKPMQVPADEGKSFEELQVDPRILEQLRKRNMKDALPVQTGMLPLLLPTPVQYPGDLCVSAPTGSGKTLGYVLPMVQSLMRHTTTCLRGLIIVPTRELVDQVREVLEMCCAGTRLHIGAAVGTHQLGKEQDMLVHKGRRYDPFGYRQLREKLERKMSYEFEDDMDLLDDDGSDSTDDLLQLLPDHVPCYSSKVDILIATPGRLVDHIKSTVGFGLSDLEWLVIDEADRLLDASFQEWSEVVATATDTRKVLTGHLPFPPLSSFVSEKQPRKVILSATMTKDLDKLSGLHLRNPKMMAVESVEDKSIVNQRRGDRGAERPWTLEEHGVPVGTGSEKPLYLMELLYHVLGEVLVSRQNKPTAQSDTANDDQKEDSSALSSGASSLSSDASTDSGPLRSQSAEVEAAKAANALIFTSSNEAAHRLAHLLAHLLPEDKDKLRTLTKSSTSRSTMKALASFRSSKVCILIATDRASRGLDLADLQNVINYDIPHSITSYVHRVGRTARAGKEGRAWTLVEDREAAWFWKEVAKGGGIERSGRTVASTRMDLTRLGAGAREAYDEALSALEKDVKGDDAQK